MRIKVELHRDVVWYVQHRCSEGEQSEFYRQLDRVREQPVSRSEATARPDLSRYLLRFFRFGRSLAIFRFDPAEGCMRILECRTLAAEPQRKPPPESDAPEADP